MGIGNVHIVQVAIECGLIGCAWMECDFDAASLSRRVVVDVEVGRLVEAMEERSWSRRIKVGMSVDVHCCQYFFAWKWWHGGRKQCGGYSFESVNFQNTKNSQHHVYESIGG